MSRISHFSRILLLLTLALLPRLAQAQRIGPLGPTDRQQSKALSTERTAAVGPPSLQLSLPPPAVAALPPLGPDDLQLLQPQEGQPPVIGIHRPLPQGSVALSFSGGTARTTAEGAWQAIPAGRLWRLRITSPSARAMRVHFRDFAIGAGKLWLYSADGQTVGPYTGSGLYGDGNFWSDIVSGDSLTIEYLPDPATTEEAVPFQIVEISHIWDDAFGNGGEAGVQPPIAASGGARTGREAAKLLTDWINIVVGTQSMEQSPAADNLPDTKTARLAKQIQLVERSASLQQPRPKAARALTPGRPVSFSRGPVDSSTLFYGDFSYQLEVPEDATRVTFTLESVDPDIDMDLFVRYGEDNDLQNGRAVSDYSSEGLTGNEEIVITPQSDPPLRAGTYFVSVALFDTGVVAMATLTAEVERDDTPLPPISGGTLTPGQPSAFRLGPVESPTLFTGDHSFRMEVPTGASRVIFTMVSVDPEVDVDLFVRYGEDNTFQNARPVFDHASLGLTGNERIGITRRSDPPLRAGTYFVSVLVFDTDVVAEGTLTATVETDAADCHLDVTCYPEWLSSAAGAAYFAYERSEGSFSCSGTLLNNTREDFTPYFLTAAHCVDTEEEARSVMAFWHYQTQTCNGELPDFLSVPRTMGASLLSTTGFREPGDPEGDMTLLRLEGDLPDGVMFQGWDADPQPVGTQVTGIHHPGSDDWGFFKRISFGQIIPDPRFGTSADVYTIVSWPPGQGYTERGSSGSALFSSPGTVIGALSFGDTAENACPTGPLLDAYTHFSVVYPHIVQFVHPLSVPGKPQAPTVSAATPYSLTVEWTEPENTGTAITDYDVQYREVGSGSFTDARHEGTALRATLTGLSPDTVYEVQVRASNATGTGAWSESGEGRTSPQQTGGPTYYFPHLAVGQKWQTTITYINYSSQEVRCTTDFLSDQGTPLMVSFADKGTVPSRTDVLLPGGSVHQETNVELNAPFAPGWARATCSGPVKASLLFRLHNSEGVPIAEGGVNAAAVPATRFVTFAEQGAGQFGTGVAYANPSDTAALVTFTARDADGQMLASVDKNLSPNGHAAQNMAALFALSSFTGSLEITSTEPIVSLSINAEAAPIFSSLPPGELDAAAQGSTTYYFPHLAVGASWQTTITYINYSPQEVTCQTDFLSDQGTPLMVSFADKGTVPSRTDVLLPGGSVHQETNVELNAPFAPGWARATCSGPVKASLLFRLHNSEGVPIAEGGVNAAAVPATRFVTFAEQGAGQFGTGVAYANPSDTAALVTFTARDADGQMLASVDKNLSPNGHAAQNMAALFALSSFTGSLEITSTEPIVSLSINAEAAPVFSSLPPGDLDAAPAIPGEMPAPDLVVQIPFAPVSDSAPAAGANFTLSVTVRNVGDEEAAATTLRYYRSNDTTISSSDTPVGRVAVSALPASGTSAESIPLTAPSSAGTYYYGACVDPVSGESDTGNNCSSAVRVTVSASQIGSAGFDLASENGSPEGIVFANNRFYVVDWVDDKVYAYQASGQRDSASDFDLDSTTRWPRGIAFANDRFYVVDWPLEKVYAYQATGQRDSASDFDLDSDTRLPCGITFANNRFYVVDGFDDKVYAYQAAGQRDSASDFDLDSANRSAEGITFANNRFYVVEDREDRVYAYDASGQRASAFDLYLDPANGDASGIEFANNRFYVVDDRDDRVYAYSAGVGPGQPTSDALFPVRRQAGGIRTAAALHNLEAEALGVRCRLMSGGVALEEVEIHLEANGQASWFIEDAFTTTDTSDFGGSVRCTAPGNGRFTAVALEMDAANRIFTTLPVVPVDPPGSGNQQTTLDFAHFANGTSITSEMVFLNPSTQPSRPAVYFYDTEGNPIAAESVVDITGDLEIAEDGALTVQTEMEPLGVLTISTHGRGQLVTGSARVVSEGPIGGMLRFEHPDFGVAGVGASPPVSDALFPVRRQEGGINTGVALHNLKSSPGLLRCDLMREGVLRDVASIPLEANGQTSWLINQAFPAADTSDFAGSVRCDAVGEGLFSAVALEMDPANRIFATLPLVPVLETPSRE